MGEGEQVSNLVIHREAIDLCERQETRLYCKDEREICHHGILKGIRLQSSRAAKKSGCMRTLSQKGMNYMRGQMTRSTSSVAG